MLGVKSKPGSIGLKSLKYQKESIVLENFLMSPEIIASVHAPVEITKPRKIGLGYAVLEAGVCFRVLNGMKGQIIQGKTAVQGIEVSINIFCEWLQASKHVKNERMQARNNLQTRQHVNIYRHVSTQAREK